MFPRCSTSWSVWTRRTVMLRHCGLLLSSSWTRLLLCSLCNDRWCAVRTWSADIISTVLCICQLRVRGRSCLRSTGIWIFWEMPPVERICVVRQQIHVHVSLQRRWCISHVFYVKVDSGSGSRLFGALLSPEKYMICTVWVMTSGWLISVFSVHARQWIHARASNYRVFFFL